LPPTPAGPTPLPSCCDRGGTCEPDDATFLIDDRTAPVADHAYRDCTKTRDHLAHALTEEAVDADYNLFTGFKQVGDR
jgi:hypothetical protein